MADGATQFVVGGLRRLAQFFQRAMVEPELLWLELSADYVEQRLRHHAEHHAQRPVRASARGGFALQHRRFPRSRRAF